MGLTAQTTAGLLKLAGCQSDTSCSDRAGTAPRRTAALPLWFLFPCFRCLAMSLLQLRAIAGALWCPPGLAVAGKTQMRLTAAAGGAHHLAVTEAIPFTVGLSRLRIKDPPKNKVQKGTCTRSMSGSWGITSASSSPAGPLLHLGATASSPWSLPMLTHSGKALKPKPQTLNPNPGPFPSWEQQRAAHMSRACLQLRQGDTIHVRQLGGHIRQQLRHEGGAGRPLAQRAVRLAGVRGHREGLHGEILQALQSR